MAAPSFTQIFRPVTTDVKGERRFPARVSSWRKLRLDCGYVAEWRACADGRCSHVMPCIGLNLVSLTATTKRGKGSRIV